MGITSVQLSPDQPACVFCEQCADDYCDVCFHSQHRKGTRKKHTTKALVSQVSQKRAKRSNGKPAEVSLGAKKHGIILYQRCRRQIQGLQGWDPLQGPKSSFTSDRFCYKCVCARRWARRGRFERV